MSSRNIEREIVQMEWDGRKFSSGIQGSMDDLSGFKKSFDMSQAQQSLSELDKSANNLNFSGMHQGIDAVTAKFSLMGAVAFTVIQRLTNAMIDLGKQVVSALFVDPVKTGLEEYEIQLNAIQTILANTKSKGTTLEDVNSALDELNEYADLTIYNFTQMTSAIGKFTTAGVDLDTSVQAIKGLSNIAAISGANAEDASRAYWQLSQAISAGTIRLQDWMSIENANMGGEAFRESLMETARLHGIAVDEMVEKHGSFRLSLQESWLSSEIMLETLAKFTGELSDEDLLAMGYTEEQILAIQEMAQTALDAATKIKTVTQLVDVLKEALQSGWAQTWRIVFGDFEEAKELWGTVGEILSGEIEESARRRNALLEYWSVFGGRDSVISGFLDLLRAGINILHAFGDAVQEIFKPIRASRLVELSTAFAAFAEKIKMASENTGTFQRIVKGLAAILDIAIRIILAIARPIGELISNVISGSGAFWEWVASIADAIVAWREMAIEADLFNNVVANVIAFFQNLAREVLKAVDSFMELEVIQDISGWIRDLKREDFVALWEGLLTVLRAVVTPFVLIGVAIGQLYKEILKLEVVQNIIEYFKELTYLDVKNAFLNMKESIKEFFASLRDSEILEKFVTLIKTFDGRRLSAFLDELKSRFGFIGDAIDSVMEKLKGFAGSAGGSVSSGVGSSFENIGETLKEGIIKALDWLIENAQNIDYSAIFDAINTGLLAGLLVSLRKLASGSWLSDAIGEIFGKNSALGNLTEGLTESLGSLQGVLTAYQTNIKADTLQKIAIAIAIFAGALLILTLLDTTKLQTASIVVGGMLATLFGSSAVMSRINTRDIAKTSIAIIGLSAALAISAFALGKVSNLNGEQIKNSLAAMAAGLVGLVLSVNTISAGKGTAKNIAMLLGLGVALNILAGVIRKFGDMDQDTLTQGLIAVGSSLAILVTSLALISKTTGDGGLLTAATAIATMAFALDILAGSVTKLGEMDPKVLVQGLEAAGAALAGFAAYSRLVDPAGMLAASVALVITSASLLILAAGLKSLGEMDQDSLIQGMIAMAAALLLIVIAANAMTGAIAGAAAMLVMSIALIAIAGALTLLGNLSWEQLLIALAALAGVFLVLVVAGLAISPVLPVLLALAGLMLIIGAAAALLGLGIFLAATGLVALGASAAVVAAGIGIVGVAIVEVLPKLAEAFGQALVNFITVIAENTPTIVESFKTIVLGMIQGARDLIPDMAAAILEMITAVLEAIGEALPDLIQAGFDILLAFIQGIADNIQEVVDAGLEVLTEFLAGIESGLPELVDQAFATILAFLNAIKDAVEFYVEDIIAAGIAIGVAIIEGVAQAIRDGAPAIQEAVWALVQAALDALGLGFLIESPSKVTYKIGEYVVEGLINGIRDSIEALRGSMKEATDAVKDEVDKLKDAVSDAIDEEWEVNPVVNPIVDLDSLTDSVPEKWVELVLGPPYVDAPPPEGWYKMHGQQVVYNQYNYSPDPLDSDKIYRQTKTQVAKHYKRANGL